MIIQELKKDGLRPREKENDSVTNQGLLNGLGGLVSTSMKKARGVAKFPIPLVARANQTKKKVTTSPSGF